jgi:dTDP-4-dehydrorhamnose 3,5-epimerase
MREFRMPFRFEPQKIPEVCVIEPRVFADGRGFFMETYKHSDFAAAGISAAFVQDNHSHSARGTLRGLHFQSPPKAQGKLIRVMRGEVFDVAVDLRRGSPTYAAWAAVTLSAENKRMVYVPPWCAHGFCVLSEEAEVLYKTTEEYAPDLEGGLMWNDPALQIAWPMQDPVLSERDRRWPAFVEFHSPFSYGPEPSS